MAWELERITGGLKTSYFFYYQMTDYALKLHNTCKNIATTRLPK